MNSKTLKIFSVIVMAIVVVCSMSQVALAAVGDNSSAIVDGISADTSKVDATSLQTMAGNFLGLIQVAAAVATVVLVAVFGFKFILGSASEKADYQKSFIPLIVGVVVVFAASSIAKIIFSTFGS